MKNLFVAGAVFMLGLSAAYAQQDSITTFDSLKVDNNLNVGNRLTIEGDARAESELRVGGVIYYPNAPTFSGDLESREFAVFNPNNGAVEKSGIESILQQMYSKQCATVNGVVLNPVWQNGPNKIFHDCPDVFTGFGTNEPLHKVDVRGTTFTTNLLLGNYATTGFPNQALIDGLRPAADTTVFVRFGTRKADGTDEVRFRVAASGAVWATSYRVRLAATIPVPDFAFNQDYKPMALPELEKYIKKNHHLPNIPSEAEIREQGLSLDEMQMKLLLKVEELTLYTIELNKKIEAQAAENEALKAKVAKQQKRRN